MLLRGDDIRELSVNERIIPQRIFEKQNMDVWARTYGRLFINKALASKNACNFFIN